VPLLEVERSDQCPLPPKLVASDERYHFRDGGSLLLRVSRLHAVSWRLRRSRRAKDRVMRGAGLGRRGAPHTYHHDSDTPSRYKAPHKRRLKSREE
jgi:hypothetical protein